jgi:hypothetical protein
MLNDQYESYLKSNVDVDEYKRDFIPIIYWDDDYVEKRHMISFYVKWKNGKTEWIECIPHKDLRPIKKYLYARRIAESFNVVFRGLNSEELSQCASLSH